MTNINLFWSVYKNLENELLTLTKYIHFSDKQLTVYTAKSRGLSFHSKILFATIKKSLLDGCVLIICFLLSKTKTTYNETIRFL